MGLRTTIAFAITVGVIGAAAALAWSERRIATDRGHQVRDEQRRASVGPAGSMENEGLFSSGPLDQLVVDPPDAAWRAEPSTPVLSCDAALAPAKLRIGTGRWSGTGSDGGLDYKEYEKYDARLNQKLDGSHSGRVGWRSIRVGVMGDRTAAPTGVRTLQCRPLLVRFVLCLRSRFSERR